MDPDKPEDVISVFVPTSPNPTTGFLLFLKRQQVHTLPLTVADAMKMIMSVGAVSGADDSNKRTTLLDHVEQWIYKRDKSSKEDKSGEQSSV